MYSQQKPIVVVMDAPSNLHSFRTVYHDDYDRLRLPALSHHLPLNLIEMLIEGPVAFCLHCTRPIFSLGPVYPLFVLKIMVRDAAAGASIQPVVCSVFFCSVQCSFSYKSMFEPLLDWKQLDATW